MTEREIDERIAGKEELIAKEEAEIERRKKRIEKLKAEIRVLNEEKKNVFGKDLLKFFIVRGINSTEQREELFKILEERFPLLDSNNLGSGNAETNVDGTSNDKTTVEEIETEEIVEYVSDEETEETVATSDYYVSQISETDETYSEDEVSETENYYRQPYQYNTGNFKKS